MTTHDILYKSVYELEQAINSKKEEEGFLWKETLFFHAQTLLSVLRIYIQQFSFEELVELSSAPFLLLELGEINMAKEVFESQCSEMESQELEVFKEAFKKALNRSISR